MNMNNTQNKLIGVFGLGQSGMSVARYLNRIGHDFFVIDTRKVSPNSAALNSLSHCKFSQFGDVPQTALNNAAMIVVSPGVSPQIECLQQAKQLGVEIIGDVELFVRQTKKKVVAITGSNGKSTVTDLTHKLLCAAGYNAKLGGNIGVPVLDHLPQDDADIYVLELSSFQLDTTHSLKADVAVVLNITQDHMDRYSCFTDYCQSKLSIYKNARNTIENADDELTIVRQSLKSTQFSLLDENAKYHVTNLNNSIYLVCNNKKICDVNTLQLSGSHNWCNALVAIGILSELNVKLTPDVIKELQKYQGLRHRFELVKRKNSIDWINDSKATNVGATIAALNSVDLTIYPKLILIAGGDAKGSNLNSLKKPLTDKVSSLILIGKDADLLAELMPQEKVTFAATMIEAVKQASKILGTKQTKAMVLLSPACASLDMYKNYEARGQDFVAAVEAFA